MRLTRQQVIIVGVVGVIVVVLVLGFMGVIPGIKKSGVEQDPNFPQEAVKLTVWGVDLTGKERQAFIEIAKSYEALHKNVKASYTGFASFEQFEQALVDAFAEGTGPDVFMIDSTWVPKHKGKMLPADPRLATAATAQILFPDVVTKDFVADGQLYALPLDMDGLALIYNKDMFNARSILYAPQTWEDVLSVIPKLRMMEGAKQIKRAALALGGARNVAAMPDILSVLMLQNGSAINTKEGGVRLDGPAQQAVTFYMQFADPINVYYTWHEGLEGSREAFAGERVAMIVDYAAALLNIRNRNSFLNIGVAPLPQVNADRPISFARYRGLAVSRQTRQPYVAWDFVRFITTQPANSQMYLTATGQLPALKSMINTRLGEEKGSFLQGALIAKTWQQADSGATKSIFETMILDIAAGRLDVSRAVRAAESQLNQVR